MNIILEGLLKGLVLWLYGLILDGVNYLANSLLDVFNMDLSYFETYAPVTTEIVQVIIATGWALLIGNLVFQATRSMAAGIGFEGEDPKILFTRTFVFSFLLVASRQICNIGLGVTATVMDLLRIPDAVNINTPDESAFGMSHSSQQGGSTTVNNSQSQTTQGGANSTRHTAPPQSPANGGIAAGGRATPPISGAKGGAGIDRTSTPSSASRPPIGHNATTVNSISQESRPPSPGRNAPAQRPAGSDRPATPSPGRDTATASHSTTAQTLPPSPGRNSTPQGAPPSVGRNGASAPQKPLSPPQGVDRTQSPPPSLGRNSAPQSAPPPSQGSDSNPQREQTQPPLPLSPGRNDPPKRPPIGHDRKPPQGS